METQNTPKTSEDKKASVPFFALGVGWLISLGLSVGFTIHYTEKKIAENPVAAQFAVIDMGDLSKYISGLSKEETQAAAQFVKDKLEHLNSAGVVVLDHSLVVSAPAEAVINADLIKSEIRTKK